MCRSSHLSIVFNIISSYGNPCAMFVTFHFSNGAHCASVDDFFNFLSWNFLVWNEIERIVDFDSLAILISNSNTLK